MVALKDRACREYASEPRRPDRGLMGCVAEELSSALERGRGWEGQEVVLQVEGWANAKVCGLRWPGILWEPEMFPVPGSWDNWLAVLRTRSEGFQSWLSGLS